MQSKSSVTLIDHCGSDKTHALAAWASTFDEFGLELPEDIKMRVDHLVNYIVNNTKRKRPMDQLIEFLAEEEHTSPFRFSTFIFTANNDLTTHIQKLKHRVILEAENGESGRYKELTDRHYLPEDWLEYGEVGKKWYEALEKCTNMTNQFYHDALKELTQAGMSKKRAKESTRFFRMVNSQIYTVNKMSFDGILQFYWKRGDDNIAQNEIAEMANQMVNMVRNIPGDPFHYSLKAFGL